jgi:hypothetical protein
MVGAAASFCNVEAKRAVETFFGAHPVPAAERTLRQVLETIETCAGVQERQQPKLAAWLSGPRPATR